MAQMLRDEDSTERHLQIVRRHQRRCRRTKGAADLATRIEAARAALKQKAEETARKREAEQDARDDLELFDEALDDEISIAFNRSEEYDKKNPGKNSQALLFPTGRKTDVTEADVFVEPMEAEKMARAIEGLGAEDPLYPLAESIRAAAAASRGAGDAVNESLRQRKLAEADEEIAQAELRRAYEANYLDGRKTLGRRIAERLFPKVQRRVAAPPEAEPTPPA